MLVREELEIAAHHDEMHELFMHGLEGCHGCVVAVAIADREPQLGGLAGLRLLRCEIERESWRQWLASRLRVVDRERELDGRGGINRDAKAKVAAMREGWMDA